MTNKTADLCDAQPGTVRVLSPLFTDYGGTSRFAGGVATVRVFEDNTSVRESLAEPGEGRVLVVDGAGSLRCALLGGNLGAMAQRNGWAGVLVYGCVRDATELAELDIAVKALNVHPRRSAKGTTGERDAAINIGGVTIRPGEWLCGDEDGVVIADRAPE